MNKHIKVALAGNPNSGKSSLFNQLTGLRQKVGNYPGVTVDKKTGLCQLPGGKNTTILDLPGCYSIYPRSADEQVVTRILLNPDDPDFPDLVIVVADATNLKRSLLLTTQIMDLGFPVIIALNMVDIARKQNQEYAIPALEKALGVPVIPINAREGKGIDDLKAALAKCLESPCLTRKPMLNVAEILPQIKTVSQLSGIDPDTDYRAFQILLQHMNLPFLDKRTQETLENYLAQHQLSIAQLQGKEILKRYELIDEILKKSVIQTGDGIQLPDLSTRLDKILTHPVFGYLIFLAILLLIFQAIFAWSEYPMLWIESIFISASELLYTHLPSGWLTDLLVKGIIAGLGGIAVFIPQIMLLFGAIAILEDTGYMSRVSFLLDKLMRKVGMSGKSVVPLVSGFACAVPAVMATRTIGNWKQRLITIMVIPLMSCSARIPVYTLMTALFVPDKQVLGFLNLQGLVMLALYMTGIIAAVLIAFLLDKWLKTREYSHYLMELPVYRSPRWKNVLITMVEKARIFVVEAGKVILVISIILWALASYGPRDRIARAEETVRQEAAEKGYTAEQLDNALQSARLKNSWAGILGKTIEPVIKPLGFDWKIGIALITSFAAREVFVGTMATIYSVGEDESDFKTIRQSILEDKDPQTGKPTYTLATAISLMVFYAFALQCMSTVAIVRRETKSWKWPVFQFVLMALLAYAGSWVAYHIFS